jgi:hypothetical protein
MTKPTTTTKTVKLIAAAQQQLEKNNNPDHPAVDPLIAKLNKKNIARTVAKAQLDTTASDAIAAEQLNQDDPEAQISASLAALESAINASVEDVGAEQPLQLAQRDTGTRSDVRPVFNEQPIYAVPEGALPYAPLAAGGNIVAPVAAPAAAAVSATSAAAAGGISFADLLLPLLGAAAVGAGVGYAAGNSNGGDNNNSSTTAATSAATPVPAAPTLNVANAATTGILNLTGSAAAGSTVNIYDNGTLIATTTATSAGTYSTTNTTPLTSGTHNITARASNSAGTSSASENWNVIVGSASDGPLQGAAVYLDANHNNQVDAGELQVATTDANGNFVYVTQVSVALLQFVGLAGSEITTGAPNTLTLNAPMGYTHLNPVTTLIAKVATIGNISAAEAEVLVENALNLPVGNYANINVGADLDAQKLAAKLAVGALLPNDTDGTVFFTKLAEKVLAQTPDNNTEPAVDAFIKDALATADTTDAAANATAYDTAAAAIKAATTIPQVDQALDDIQISELTPAQIAALTPAQLAKLDLASLSPAQTAALTAAQAATLTPAQVKTLADAGLLDDLSDAAEAALPVDSLDLLTPAQIAALPVEFIDSLAPATLGSLSPAQVAELTPTQVATLSPEQVKALADAGLLDDLTDAAEAALPVDSLDLVTPAQIAALPAEFIDSLTPATLASLSPEQIAALTPAQAATLSPEQVKALADANLLDDLSDAAETALIAEALDNLTPAQIANLPVEVIDSLAPATLASLSPAQIAALTAAQAATLDQAQLKALADAGLLDALADAAETALIVEALDQLTPAQIAALPAEFVDSLSPATLASLSPEQIAALTAAQAATLSPEQVKALADAALLDDLADAAEAALAADSLDQLSPTQIAALPVEVIDSLAPATLASLSPEQIAALTPAQAATLSPEQVAALAAAALLDDLTDAAETALPVDSLDQLTPTQIAALPVEVIDSLAPATLASLSPAQVAALTADQTAVLETPQIDALTAANLIASLSPAANAALGSANLDSLTPAQLAALTPAQLAANSPAAIGEISAAQAALLSPEQVKALADAGLLDDLSDAAEAALPVNSLDQLSPAQIAALPVEVIDSLAPATLASLSPEQIAALTPAQAATLSPEQVKALADANLLDDLSDAAEGALIAETLDQLTPAQIAALPAEFFDSLTPAVIASLSPAQVAALTADQTAVLETPQIDALTAANLIASLSPAANAALGSANLDSLTPAQLAALTPAQLAANSPAAIGEITAAQAAVLSPEQVKALADANLLDDLSDAAEAALVADSLDQLTPAQIATLPVEVIDSLAPATLASLSPAQIAELTPVQAATLSPEQVKALADAGLLDDLADAAEAALVADSLDQLTPTQIAALPVEVIDSLAPATLASLSPEQIAVLTPAQAATLSPEQVKALADAALLDDLSDAAEAALVADSLDQLTPAQIAALPAEFVDSLAPATLASPSPEQIAALTAAQAATLSPEQVKALADAALLDDLADTAEAALVADSLDQLTPAQIAALPVEVIDSLAPATAASLSPEQIAALTPAQVATLDTPQLSALTSAGLLDDLTAPLSQAQLNGLGASQIDTAPEVSLLNDAIQAADTAEVDTPAEVLALAAITQKVIDQAAGTNPGLTEAELASLGIFGVTAANLPAVLAAIAATADTGSAVDTLAELQAVAISAMDSPSAAQAKIAAYAQDNGAANPAPSVADYTAAGVTGVDANNLAAINAALASTPVTGTNADTAPEVQAIVDAYKAILAEANGATADATPADPTAANYAAIGATLGAAASDAENLALLNDIVGNKTAAEIDTPAELTALADIVNRIAQVAAGQTPATPLTAADLAAAGLTGVTAANLPAVLAAIAATADDGSGIDSLAEMQAIANGFIVIDPVAAQAKIAAYAQDNGAANPAPSVADYTSAGVTGVDANNLAAINAALASTPVTGTNADTAPEVQAIVDAYKAILAEANGATADATPADPTAANYAAIGATLGSAANQAGSDAETLALLNDIVGNKTAAEIDTPAELTALADIANRIAQTAAGQTPTTPLTAADLTAAGLTGVTAANLPAVLAAIAATPDDGTGIDSLAELQPIATAAAVTAAQAAIAAYAESNSGTAPSVADYTAAGVIGVDPANLAAINAALASTPVIGTSADTQAETQAIVDAYKAIIAEANGATADATPAADPTAANYAAIGATLGSAANQAGTDPETLALLNDIVGNKTAAEIDTPAELTALADIANRIAQTAAGLTASPALTAADLTAAGITGVTAGNLAGTLAAIAATADDGSGIDSLAELQALAVPASPTPTLLVANTAAQPAGNVTLSGTAAASASLKFYDNGVEIVGLTATANGTGDYSVGTTLTAGAHAITATATLSGQGTSLPTAGWNVIIGSASDGALQGAAVYIDANTNGLIDGSEASTTVATSDAAGNYSWVTQQNISGVRLISQSGTEIVNNAPNFLILKALPGYYNLNPITTLIAAVFDNAAGSLTAAQAEARVEAALNLPAATDFTTYNVSSSLPTQQVAAKLALAALLPADDNGAAYFAALAASINASSPANTTTPTVDALIQGSLADAGDKATFATVAAGINAATTTAQVANLLDNIQIAEISATQAAGLSAPQMDAWTAEQVGFLSDAAFAALTPAPLAGLNAAQGAGITAGQLNALAAANPGNVGQIDDAAAAALTNGTVAALNATAAQALDAGQLSALNAAGKLDDLTQNLSQAQLGGLTASVIDTPAEAALLNTVIQAQDTGTPLNFTALAATVQNIMAVAADGSASPALTVADFTALGITGVTTANLPGVLATLAASNNDLSAVDTLGELQTLVSTVPLAPALAATQALDNVTNIDVRSNLTINFNEGVTGVAGKFIRIVNDAGVGIHGENVTNTLTIEASDTNRVAIVGNKVTLNPGDDLDFGNNYHIEIDAGAFTGLLSGVTNAAVSDVAALNFTTVTPDASTTAGTLSQKFDATGNLVNSYKYIDLEDRSSPIAAPAQLNAAGNDYAYVATDYSSYVPPASGPGDTGIATDDFFVRLYNFGLGDLLYVDTHGNNADISMTRANLTTFTGSGTDTLSGAGTRWKGISFTGITSPESTDTTGGGLGGNIRLSLEATAETPSDSTVAVTYATLPTLLGTTIDNIFVVDSGPTSATAAPIAALNTISAAAEANNATATTPAASVYASAGVTGVDAGNLAAINSLLDSAPINAAAVDTAAEVQTVVSAYNAIVPGADNTNDNDVALTQALATALGLTAINTPAELALLNDILDNALNAEIDTAAELTALASVADRIATVAAGGVASPALTAAELSTAGITGVTTANLPSFLTAIAGTADDGSGIDSLSAIQTIVAALPTAPTLATQALDNVSNFDVHSKLAINFSEAVTGVAGKTITIVNDAGVGIHGENVTNTLTIDAGDTNKVAIVGNKVILNPAYDLDFGNNYHIEIEAGAFIGQGSGQGNAAITDNTVLNFSTVTPDATTTAGNLSQKFDDTGALVNSYRYIDLEDRSSPIAAPAQLNAGGNDYAYVATDYSSYVPPASGPGDTGIATDDFFVRLYNFGLGDLLYVDTHGNNTDVSMTRANLTTFTGSGTDTLSGAGTRWKGISFTGITSPESTDTTGGGLGGNIRLSLEPSADTPSDSTVAVTYATLPTLLGTTTDNVYVVL